MSEYQPRPAWHELSPFSTLALRKFQVSEVVNDENAVLDVVFRPASSDLASTQLPAPPPRPAGVPVPALAHSLFLSVNPSLSLPRYRPLCQRQVSWFQRPGSRQHGTARQRHTRRFTYLQSQHCGVDSPTVSHLVSCMNLKNSLHKLSTRARAIISDKQLAVIKLTLSYFRTVLPPKYPITSNVKYLQC